MSSPLSRRCFSSVEVISSITCSVVSVCPTCFYLVLCTLLLALHCSVKRRRTTKYQVQSTKYKGRHIGPPEAFSNSVCNQIYAKLCPAPLQKGHYEISVLYERPGQRS